MRTYCFICNAAVRFTSFATSLIIVSFLSLCLMNSTVMAVGTWQIETVDSTSWLVGGHTSLAFDSSGNPAISYFDETNGDLKYAHQAAPIPEPSTIALLGSGLAMLPFLRRRFRFWKK